MKERGSGVIGDGEKVWRHLFNGINSCVPVLICCFYMWVVGYYLPILTLGFVLIVLLSFLFGVFSSIFNTIEEERNEKLRNQQVQQLKKEEQAKDIHTIMLSNTEEIREYYFISKRHANLSFILSISFCLAGLLGFAAVLIQIDNLNSETISTGMVSSAFVELFAATALVIHRSTLKQLNIYYNSLHENERFLLIVDLANQLPEEKRADTLIAIINSSLINISVTENGHECSNTQENTQ